MSLVSDQSFQTIFYLASGILWACAGFQILDLLLTKPISKNIIRHDNYLLSSEGKNQGDLESYSNTTWLKIFLIGSIFLVGLVIAQLSSTYPIYIKNQLPHEGMRAISFLFILDTLIIVLFQSSLPKYYNKIPTFLVMGLGALMTGLGTFILIWTDNLALATLSCICWTLGEMLFIPTSATLSYELGEQNKKGASLGLFQSSFALSKVAGPSIGAAIYDVFSPTWLWLSASLIMLGVFFFCQIANQQLIQIVNLTVDE